MSLPRTSARFLLRLVRELAPRSCLELGTGFGISTAYQAAGLELNGTGRITTLDIRGMMEIAAPGLSRLGLAGRVELVSGRIEDTMAGALDAGAPIDSAFLDADHTEIGTIAPFEAIVPHLSPGAVVVFDDINWTSEMRRAWRRVSARPEVVAAYGVHRLGVAIVGPDGGG